MFNKEIVSEAKIIITPKELQIISAINILGALKNNKSKLSKAMLILKLSLWLANIRQNDPETLKSAMAVFDSAVNFVDVKSIKDELIQ
jgi:hypothetical protein